MAVSLTQIFSKINGKARELVAGAKALPERTRAEFAGKPYRKSMAVGVGAGLAIGAFDLAAKALVYPFWKQGGDYYIPETVMGVGALALSIQFAVWTRKAVKNWETPITIRGGLIGGMMGAALISLPYHEAVSEYVEDIVEHGYVPPEAIAEFIEGQADALKCTVWETSCMVAHEQGPAEALPEIHQVVYP